MIEDVSAGSIVDGGAAAMTNAETGTTRLIKGHNIIYRRDCDITIATRAEIISVINLVF